MVALAGIEERRGPAAASTGASGSGVVICVGISIRSHSLELNVNGDYVLSLPWHPYCNCFRLGFEH